MKLLRHGPKGQERPGLLDEQGGIRDLSDHVTDIDSQVLAPERLNALARLDTATLPVVEGSVRLGTPVATIGKIVAVGLNYADHAAETGIAAPEEPILFTKTINAISGPNDPVILPQGATKGDWEVELAAVIGRRASYVAAEDSLDFVAGYTICNDVSERAFQLEGTGQWLKGKSADTFAPLGPWLVTTDEISDPQNLKLWCEVNGVRHQDSTTRQMIFGVAHLVAYISRFMTLEPGDVIATGTPSGVGLGQNPQIFLKPGDVMRLGVEGLGAQCQDVQAWPGNTPQGP